MGFVLTAINNARWARPHYSRWILSVFTAVAAVCFAGALVTDIAYIQSPDMQWTNFSAWLLAVGIAASGLAVLMSIVVFFKRERSVSPNSWLYAGSTIIVVGLELFNNFIHSRDAWQSVWPTGISLSAAAVLMMGIAAAFNFGDYKTHNFEDIRR
jgi:uncharacterized membrane protein